MSDLGRCRWTGGCDLVLIPHKVDGRRRKDLAPGYGAHCGRGLCQVHYDRARGDGSLNDYPRRIVHHSTAEMLAAWEAGRARGLRQDEVAADLGIKRSALKRGVAAARRRLRDEQEALRWSRPGLFDASTADEGE